jgi:hypothetical protein
MLNSWNNWEIGIGIGNSRIKWISIATVEFDPEYKRRIGITEHGVWITSIEREGANSQLFVIENRQDCYHLMAILEKDRNEIENLIKNGLEKNNLNKDKLITFPFKDLIKFTLANDSSHWALKAKSWIRESELDDEFVDISNNIIKAKKLDQKTRHDLFKLVNRYKKNVSR